MLSEVGVIGNSCSELAHWYYSSKLRITYFARLSKTLVRPSNWNCTGSFHRSTDFQELHQGH
jgi:hypothetical protein